MNESFKYKNLNTVNGMVDSLSYEYIVNYYNNNDDSVFIITDNLYQANKVYKGIYSICKDICLFPVDDFLSSISFASSPDLKIMRLDTLNSIENNKKNIIVTNLTGYLKLVDKNSNILNISSLNRNVLLKFLDETGYNKTSLVTSTGEYAVRSYIVDVFPINEVHPIRFEFFGDEIDSIRFFDESTQISTVKCDIKSINGFSDESSVEKITLYDKLNNPYVFYYDYDLIKKSYSKLLNEVEGFDFSSKFDSIMCKFGDINVLKKEFINLLSDNVYYNIETKYKSESIVCFNNNFKYLQKYVNNLINNKIVIFMVENKILIDKLISIFGNNISFNSSKVGVLNVINKSIIHGFIYGDYVVIGEHDIENTLNRVEVKNKYKIGKKLKGLDDLSIGDYIVHSSHGIGIYRGLVTLNNNGISKDYLLLEYAGNDKVYIPAQKIETIFKYSDKDGDKPKLNSLNSTNWAKTKLKVRNKIKDISDELLKLYAEREMTEGDAYKSFPEELIFASDFEYEETIDQTKSINEILKDLSIKKPMDRLLCGDVGFGKTEVAMRAMFRTVLNNNQVAYLCPTTILSKQQYNSAIKRFRHFPVNIVLLNRFTSSKEFSSIVDGLKKGTIDIVIGTHKLLNNKIEFKDLGLLVIDEEQRFGVSQKEKIKKIKSNVNVLTLSATPIPRTLKLAMGGIKDLSILDTPPVNRYPIQTYVIEENDLILRDAIYKELSRDGQAYVLVNNISLLDSVYSKIKTLVPEARVAIAHGRMDKNEIDSVVDDFVSGFYDVLLCTTIIETGIDIPNVNTLIIKDADRFGLSQLYQIRGRVGRSDKIAYAYMLFEKNKFLNDIAIKRLKTIKEFTELGSGYKIAMRDLSIRGAGELLGSDQAGFVNSVGIDLYLQMVNEEIDKLNGKVVKEETDDNNKSLINVSTHIDDNYIDDEMLKIEVHKMINDIKSVNDLNNVKCELEDRFGKVSDDIVIYMYEELFENLCDNLNINNVKVLNNVVTIELPENISNNINGDKLFMSMYSINKGFRIKYFNKRIVISLNIMNIKDDYVKYLVDLIILIQSCIK